MNASFPSRRGFHIGMVALFVVGLAVPVVKAQQALQGDTKLACTAVLCLASGQRPSECNQAIAKYFSISFANPAKTIKGRRNFLALCPADNGDPQMSSWLDALANGAGRCDAASLNHDLYDPGDMQRGYNGDGYANVECEDCRPASVSSDMPQYCAAMLSHPWAVNLSGYGPRYVGNPYKGGHWVDP